MFETLECVIFLSNCTEYKVKLKQRTHYNDLMSCSVCAENTGEVSIPIDNLPGSPDRPVAFINDAAIFTPLAAGETYLAPEQVVVIPFNVTIDPAVLMTNFQIITNGQKVEVQIQLEEVDPILNLTVIFLEHKHIILHVLLNNSKAFQKRSV